MEVSVVNVASSFNGFLFDSFRITCVLPASNMSNIPLSIIVLKPKSNHSYKSMNNFGQYVKLIVDANVAATSTCYRCSSYFQLLSRSYDSVRFNISVALLVWFWICPRYKY